MAQVSQNNYPKLHNAMWPGLVGKGPDSEPPIDLDTMLNLTAAAEVGGVKFDGVDLFLYDPHISIDSSDDELKRCLFVYRRAVKKDVLTGHIRSAALGCSHRQ